LASFKSHIDYGIFHPIQKAAVMALTSAFSFLQTQVNEYEIRRDAFGDLGEGYVRLLLAAERIQGFFLENSIKN
jgi:hypothetical protein